MKGPKDKSVRIIRVQHLETKPVIVRQSFRDQIDNELLEGK